MKEFLVRTAAQFLDRPAQGGFPGRIEVLEVAVETRHAKQIESQQEEVFAVFLRLVLGAEELPLMQSLGHRLPQAGQAIFEEIIGCAQAHQLRGPFFAERPGDHDERNVQFAILNQLAAHARRQNREPRHRPR